MDGMHMPLVCLMAGFLFVKVHSPIISSSSFIKKNRWVGFKGYQYQRK
jgi:hypothetical protein